MNKLNQLITQLEEAKYDQETYLQLQMREVGLVVDKLANQNVSDADIVDMECNDAMIEYISLQIEILQEEIDSLIVNN